MEILSLFLRPSGGLSTSSLLESGLESGLESELLESEEDRLGISIDGAGGSRHNIKQTECLKIMVFI